MSEDADEWGIVSDSYRRRTRLMNRLLVPSDLLHMFELVVAVGSLAGGAFLIWQAL